MNEVVEDRDFESEAKAQGWRPKEEFKGDEAKWVDAQTFVERGEQFVGLLKPRFDKVERELQEMRRVNRDLSDHYKKYQDKTKRELEHLESQLVAERKKAINDGDGQAFQLADDKLNEVRAQKRDTVQATQPQSKELSSTQKSWLSDNEWYTKDKTLKAVADVYADELRATGAESYMSEEEFLENITKHVKSQIPNKFTNPKRQASADVEPGTKQAEAYQAKGKAKNYGNLPSEAKAACERLIKNGMIEDSDKGRKEYAETYFEDGE